MSTISILTEPSETRPGSYRAVAGKLQAVGATVGQATDALVPHLAPSSSATLVVLQQMRPDQFFTAEQQLRLQDLIGHWRTAREAGTVLSPAEQAELDALVEAEVRAAGQRASAMLRELTP